MNQPSGHLIVQSYEGIVLVKITKERLLDLPTITAISVEMTALLERYPKPSVVIDMSSVAYMSSAMVGKLVAYYKAVTAMKGRLAVGGVRNELMPLFKLTQIDRLIRFYPDAEQAILLFRKA